MGPPKPPSKVHDGEFEVVKRLGAGCFGEVWRGVNTGSNDPKLSGQEVALKFEFRESKSAPQLFREVEVINQLRKAGTPQGVVECLYFGKEGSFNCMVMEILGKSLEDHVQACGGKLTPKTTTLIAEQVLQRIEYFHAAKIVHRDIKPENFMFGVKNKIHHVYIIDFGLSKNYWDAARNTHQVQKTGLSLTGTARYASINAHEGVEQSRRDDLEAIGHMFMYFLRGALPWSGLDAQTQEEKYRKICDKKKHTPLPDLCKGFPIAFQEYLAYCRALGFSDKPDYDKLYNLIRSSRPAGCEDKDFQWFEGKSIPDSDNLVPLEVRKAVPQPDDKGTDKKRNSTGGEASKGCCLIS